MNAIAAARIAAGLGFAGVALGAFGAHALTATLNAHGTVSIWQTAVLYHLVHTPVLWMLARETPFRRGPWTCFLLGVLVFSGSLYTLAATNLRWLGAVTPLGGVAFLMGWGWLALRAIPVRPP